VYVDLDGAPHLMGRLWARTRKNKESAAFEYDKKQILKRRGFTQLETRNFLPFWKPSGGAISESYAAVAGARLMFLAMRATRSYESIRSLCSYVSVTMTTSLACVSLTSLSRPACTVVSDPTIAALNRLSTVDLSPSCHRGSIESTGGNNSTGSPRMSRRKRCCGVVNNRRAAASVSAAITCAAMSRYGVCNTSLGWKRSR